MTLQKKQKTGRYSKISARCSNFHVQLGFHRNRLIDSVIIIWIPRDLKKTEGGLIHVCGSDSLMHMPRLIHTCDVAHSNV